MSLRLGCIADDFTGASDLALMLAEHGMSSAQVLSTRGLTEIPDTEALVVSLKTRTAPVEEAVEQSLKAANWLLERGAQQLYFKYCSTFDSTSDGNIGPVAEALLDLVDEDFTVVCPAFPDTGRQVRDGHLFVNGTPLSRSPMRDHPLTPMTESSLVNMMNTQTRPGSSAKVSLQTVRSGPGAVKNRFGELRAEGYRYAVPDIETNEDLLLAGAACDDMRLVTGASGIAMGLVPNFAATDDPAVATLPQLQGHPLVLSGSCSTATRRQVEAMSSGHYAIEVNPFDLASGRMTPEKINQAVGDAWQAGPVLVYAGSDSQEVRKAQEALGREHTAELIEAVLAGVARHMASIGCSKFIVAGGETSGAVATALNLRVLSTGPGIAAGVPWMINHQDEPQVFAFKSGNFGADDFFMKAMEMLP